VVLTLGQLALTLLPGAALALSCGSLPPNQPGSLLLAPADGAEVPANTRIWTSGIECQFAGSSCPFALFGPDGQPIEELWPSNTPDGALLFNAWSPSPVGYTSPGGGFEPGEYRLEIQADDDSESRVFTVLDELDLEAPGAPTIRSVSRRTALPTITGPCGGGGQADSVAFSAVREADTLLYLQARSTSDRSTADDEEPLAVVASGATNRLSWFGYFQPLSEVEGQVFAVDAAGNHGPPSESVTTWMPPAGCSANEDLGWLLLALPFGLRLRRA